MSLIVEHELYAIFGFLALHYPQAVSTLCEHVNSHVSVDLRQDFVVTGVIVETFDLIVHNFNLRGRDYASYCGRTFIAPVDDCAGESDFRHYIVNCFQPSGIMLVFPLPLEFISSVLLFFSKRAPFLTSKLVRVLLSLNSGQRIKTFFGGHISKLCEFNTFKRHRAIDTGIGYSLCFLGSRGQRAGLDSLSPEGVAQLRIVAVECCDVLFHLVSLFFWDCLFVNP